MIFFPRGSVARVYVIYYVVINFAALLETDVTLDNYVLSRRRGFQFVSPTSAQFRSHVELTESCDLPQQYPESPSSCPVLHPLLSVPNATHSMEFPIVHTYW